MKLWLLRPHDTLRKAAYSYADADAVPDNPWKPWYDKTFGMVVRAETEADARRIANEEAGPENRAGSGDVWLNAEYVSCTELTAEGEPGLIIEDTHAA